MDPLLKTLLSPFCVLYSLAILARDAMYRSKLLKSISFDLPIIGVGNLNTGGTGKTPMIKYLARLLMTDFQCGIMSRGYKRTSKGYLAGDQKSSFLDIGDEPFELMSSLPGLHVAVAENRVQGISEMMIDFPDTQIILLDDIFQHRSLAPGLNILLTDFANPYFNDQLLPVGRLREFKGARKRADIIMMTKCPPHLSSNEQDLLKTKLKPIPGQEVFFTAFQYGKPKPVFKESSISDGRSCVLISGIARSSYLKTFISNHYRLIHHFDFPDHHRFSDADLISVNEKLKEHQSEKPVVICTEKDAVRLIEYRIKIKDFGWDLFKIPVDITFLNRKNEFDKIVREFVNKFEAEPI